jgi:DUF1365 family protein
VKGRSAIYVGNVVHQRLTPKRHRLRHHVYWVLADLDEIHELDQRLRLFSYNAFNLISLHDEDHGDGSRRPLAEQMRAHAAAAGIANPEQLSIRILCMPRVAGYDFNPLSVYYCIDNSETLRAMIYEVNNTFGGRHTYVIPAGVPAGGEAGDDANDEAGLRQSCDKRFYVSPFLEMEMAYGFRTRVPDETVKLSVQGRRHGQAIINTALFGRRKSLSDGNIAKLALTHPMVPIKVVGAIHWHALRMWTRGFEFAEKPVQSEPSVTIVRAP